MTVTETITRLEALENDKQALVWLTPNKGLFIQTRW
jgi:hypothetical protein